MGEKISILGISGSLRKGSFNSGALRAAVDLCPDEAQIEVFDIASIPSFNQDEDQDPPAIIQEFKDRIRAADAILFATPEYNYSIPGVLKNAIDWASRPYGQSAWDGKPAAIMGASIGGIATARAQYDLRKMMVFLNMFPINKPEVMIGNCGDKFDAEGNLIDEESKKFIRQMLEALIAWTKKIK
ncbi:MAG: NAD(P)H-dependent oxidoreductase [bacterium]|nr:NAD(P)H-dependent oxidoreductase [bacterium]